MSYYLIDYENKKTLQGISTLTESDHVIFFYSNNSNTLNFSLHREIVNSPASFDYYEVAVGGKNALDFQLSSYIGYLISERPDESFFIVSSDKGFDAVIDFWKKVGEAPAKIERVNNIIEEKPEGKTATAVPQGLCEEKSKAAQQTTCEQDVKNQLKIKSKELALNDANINTILQFVRQYKTKQAINNNLMKHFKDSEKVGKITKVIKPLLKDKK